MTTTGLALSGGGARGIAHIGAIRALEEHDITITHVAGTSAGSIVGALYASGRGWEEILEFFRSVQLFSFTNYAWDKPGFVDTEKFYDQFTDYLKDDSFESLQLPLFVTATDILEGTLKVFDSGELIRPILASAAFPGLFTPVAISNSHYIDGGTLNNFPVELLSPHCEQVIGVYVNPFEKVKIGQLKHSFSILERAFKIRTASDSLAKFKDCKLVICPKGLDTFSTFSLKDTDKIFKIGYESARKALDAADEL